MSFPRYPKYKPSGVEWLGDVPEGWEVKPLRSVFKFSKGLTITKENLQDEGVNCVNYGEIHSKYGFRLNPAIHLLRCVSPEYLSSNPEALIGDGDFVFADTSEDLGGSGNFTHLRSDNPIFAGYHTIIARPRKGTCSLLLAYQIHSSVFRSQIQSQVKGVKVFSISQGILKGAKCWLPPLPEQTAIAEFLDRETGKIDGLVAEQRRLMELLKEKRQAIISHAVTKGLNPHAPMKPSGIEWLGDVPVGWEAPSLGVIIVKAELGENYDSSEAHAGLPVMKMGNLDRGFIKIDKVESLTEGIEASESLILKAGDFLFNTRNTLDLVGKVAIWREELPRATFNLNILRLTFNPRKVATSAFVNYFFNSDLGRSQLRSLAKGTTSVAAIYYKDLTALRLMIPTASEQHAIVAHLDTESAKFDILTAEAQRAIDLLQERRTALISATVSGQIDVRQQPRN